MTRQMCIVMLSALTELAAENNIAKSAIRTAEVSLTEAQPEPPSYHSHFKINSKLKKEKRGKNTKTKERRITRCFDVFLCSSFAKVQYGKSHGVGSSSSCWLVDVFLLLLNAFFVGCWCCCCLYECTLYIYCAPQPRGAQDVGWFLYV